MRTMAFLLTFDSFKLSNFYISLLIGPSYFYIRWKAWIWSCALIKLSWVIKTLLPDITLMIELRKEQWYFKCFFSIFKWFSCICDTYVYGVIPCINCRQEKVKIIFRSYYKCYLLSLYTIDSYAFCECMHQCILNTRIILHVESRILLSYHAFECLF